MNTMLEVATLLRWTEWAAVVWFLGAWTAYARFSKRRAEVRPSLLAVTNRIRHAWMLQSTKREVRVVDGVVLQNLSAGPSFFASTTILIIGGLLALLGTGERATEFVSGLPFTARTSALVFDMKLLLLTAVMVYAFFRFTWSLRQYTFVALLVAAAPESVEFAAIDDAERARFADRAGTVAGFAAETFNDGVRAYYMGFAIVAWFFSTLAFALATAGVIWVLYQREFRSELLSVLRT